MSDGRRDLDVNYAGADVRSTVDYISQLPAGRLDTIECDVL